MHRYRRRRKLHRRRRGTIVAVFSAVLAFMVGFPTWAAADPVGDVLNDLGLGNVLGGSGGGGATSPKATDTDPPYTPPLHGTNPHGQGTGATVQLFPTGEAPVPADPVSNGETVVLGSSRGEQNSSTGAYHGNVTLAYVMGFPVVQVTSNPGETKDGPLQPLQDGLDQLCSQSSGAACLTVLGMHTSTTTNSSTNSFQAFDASIGGPLEGLGLEAEALSSEGNISQDSSCQNSHGASQVAGLGAGGLAVGLFNSSSNSQACNNGTSSVNQSSSAILLNGQEVLPGCADGTPNTVLDLAPIDLLFCNVNDENGSQASSPYGVREALTDLVIPLPEAVGAPFLALVKGTTAAAESQAVAPPVTTTPTPPGATPGGGTQGATGGGRGGGAGNGEGGGNGSAAGSAAAGNGQLAFTGSDLLVLGLIGGCLVFAGIALISAAGGRRKTA
jgi:hypothetical protein